MSNSQLDDLNEQSGNEMVAKALGISVDELGELDYDDIQTNESSDGLIYNYYIKIQKSSSSAEIIEKITAHTTDNDEFITVYLELEDIDGGDFMDDDDEPEDDESPDKPKVVRHLF